MALNQVDSNAGEIGLKLASAMNVADSFSLSAETYRMIANHTLLNLIDCWKSGSIAGSSSLKPHEYLWNHYIPSKDSFEEFLIGQARGQVRSAVFKVYRGGPGIEQLRKLTFDQIDTIANVVLKHILTTPGADVNMLMANFQ